MKEHSEPSKEETKTDNELIAEFMDFTFYPAGTVDGINHASWNVKSDIKVYQSNWGELQFDKSLEWFIPAFEKFERGLSIMKMGGYRYITACDTCNEIKRSIKRGDLKDACYELAKIIKWLNKTEGMYNSDGSFCESCGSPARNCIC